MRTPGVVVNEVQLTPPPLVGVGTSTAAFVGVCHNGPRRAFITSWEQFVNIFARGFVNPFTNSGFLADAVFGFFNNGGTACHVVRVVGAAATRENGRFQTSGATPADVLTFTALHEGNFGTTVRLVLENSLYNVTVTLGNVTEDYRGLTLAGMADAINGVSGLVTVLVHNAALVPVIASPITLSGGADGVGTLTDADYIGTVANRRGIHALEDEENVNILAVPGITTAAVTQGVTDFCARRRFIVGILEPPIGSTAEAIRTWKAVYNSDHTSVNAPFYGVLNPITGRGIRLVPSAGHVAGVWARVDSTRGVHKAPAGIEANVRGVLSLATIFTEAEHGLLNNVGVNVTRSFVGEGTVLFGARTAANNYLNVRRHRAFHQQTIATQTRWVVFEPNDFRLWARIRAALNAFFLAEFNEGKLAGATPEQAFFVQCDGTLNTQQVIDSGRVIIRIGVAYSKPAEFVILEIGQWSGGATIS